jgi:hypothetical protein
MSAYYYRQDIQNKISAQNIQPTRSYNRAEVQQNIAAKQQPQTQVPITTQAPVQEYYYTHEQAQANIAARTQSPEAVKSLPQGAKIVAYDPLSQKITYRTAEQEADYQSSTRFYTAIGYPQYGGEYSPINIPSGMKVESIKTIPVTARDINNPLQKTAFNTLEVTFTKTGDTALETAIKQNDIYSFSEANPRIGGTTSPLKNKLVVTSDGSLSTVGREQITTYLTPSDKLAFKEYQIAQKNKRLTDLGVFMASAVTAPIFGPTSFTLSGARTVLTQATLGAGISLGVSQGIKGAAGGGWLTPTEALEAGVAGAIMAPLGAKTVSVLKLTGNPLRSVLGRVGVNAALGGAVSGGVEYVTTGKVSAENVLIGVASGAVFGGITEGLGRVNLRYGVTNKATSAMQEAVIKRQSTLQTLDAINTKYETAYTANKIPSYSFIEKVVMRTTGVSPLKLNTNVIGLKTIPTTSNYETYTKPGYKSSEELFTVTNKGKVVDQFNIAVEKETVNTFIREPSNPVLNYKNMVTQELKTKTASQAELFDSGSILVGKSESPDVFFSKNPKSTAAKELSTYKLKNGELLEVQPERALSFKKTSDEIFAESQKPSVDKVLEPSKMIKERGAAFENAGSPTDLETNLVFSAKKSESLSFSKQPQETIMGYEGLKENIDLFPEVKQNARLDAAIKGAEKYNVPDMSKREVLDDLNAKWFIEEKPLGVSSTKTPNVNRDSALIQELSQGKAAEPTGISKVLNDMAEKRIVDTARYATQGYTPSAYVGPSYYKQQTRQEETEDQVISYPKNSPFSLPSMVTDRTPTIGQRRGISRDYPSALIPAVGVSSFLKLPTKDKTGIGLIGLMNTPSVGVNDFINQDIYMDARVTQTQGIEPINIARETVRTVQPVINITDEPIIPITDTVLKQGTFSDFYGAKNALGFWPSDSKIAEGGFGDSFGRKRGVGTRRRRYPILSAKEFLKL